MTSSNARLYCERFGAARVACVGGPAHAQEMVHAGAALVAASTDEELTRSLAQVIRSVETLEGGGFQVRRPVHARPTDDIDEVGREGLGHPNTGDAASGPQV